MENTQETNCPLCGGVSELRHKAFPGYQAGMAFEIYYCKNCQTSFFMPRVDAGKIYEVIYKNGADVPAYDRYWRYFNSVKNEPQPLQFLADAEVAYWGIQEALRQIVNDKKTTRILELGSGLGYLTYALRKEGYDTVGLDISQEAVDQANKHFGQYYVAQDLFDFSKTNPAAFDIVVLTEVIEHIEGPVAFIEAILKLLKPEGRIILTTPNKSFYPDDIVWDTDLPPVHYWWFSEGSMKFIAEKLNLKASFIDFSNYYARFYKLHDVRKSREGILPNPLFDKDWSLLRKSKPPKKFRTAYKSLTLSIPFVKAAYIRARTWFNPNLIVCGVRGMCQCVIFQRE